MAVSVRMTFHDRQDIATRCLHALPAWFGRPDSTARYIAAAAELPMIAGFENDIAIGFLTLRDLDPSTAEIHVVGILPTHHRQGIGRRLVAAAAADCRARGLKTLTVQTVGPSHPDLNYAKTRAFYAAVGFVPVREEIDAWGPGTPRLTLAMALDSVASQPV